MSREELYPFEHHFVTVISIKTFSKEKPLLSSFYYISKLQRYIRNVFISKCAI